MSSSQKNEEAETFKPRALGLQEGLAEMYQEELLYDITLTVDGQKFPCHRVLLAAISPHFRDIFTNARPNEREISLKNVSPTTIQSILKYIYTEEITLTLVQAPAIFAGASQLQIAPLRDISCRFLIANLDLTNCFRVHSLAHTHRNQPLLQATVKFLILNFEKLFEEWSFLQLDLETLKTLVSSNDLVVTSELNVYKAVWHWVTFQLSKRSPHLGTLMGYIRFPLFTPKEQMEFQNTMEKWGDLQIEWDYLDSQERLRKAGRLRQGMYKPHILCIDSQVCKDEEVGNLDAYMACYEPQREEWERLPGLPSLTNACCTAGGTKIYVSGGVCRNSYSSALYEFDSFQGQWVELPSMATPRCAHGFLFCNQSLFAVGGCCKSQTFLDTAERFDLGERRWAEIARLPFALNRPASCVFRNRLYFLGGATGMARNWVFHEGLLIYEPTSDAWIQVPLCVGFFGAGAVAVDNGIYVIGGFFKKKPRDLSAGAMVFENRHATRKCFFLNEAGEVSYNIPKLPRGIANAGVVCCNKRIYVLGGEDLTQCYNTIYYWTPGARRWYRTADIPFSRDGISQFGCTVWRRPKPLILQLFQKPSRVLVAAIFKLSPRHINS